MAENKKSFILYADQIGLFEKLTDAKAGKLIKIIFDYVNDKNPIPDEVLLQVAFEPIKLQLKRDLKEWQAERSKRSEAGKKGGIKSGESRRSGSKRSSASKNEANEAVTVNVTVTDTVIKRVGFAPPAKGDVVNEMMLKLDDFTAMGEADKFMNHYESKGWIVGKTKMKDWKAAVRGWLSRVGDFKKPVIQMKTEPDQTYRYEKL